MSPDANPTLVQTEAPREREEMFPMQEQDSGPTTDQVEVAAAAVLIQRIVECKFCIAAPIFVP